MAARLAQYRQRLDRLAGSRPMTEPVSYFREKRLLLDYQSSRLIHGLQKSAAGQRERLVRLSRALPDSGVCRVARQRERLNTLAAALDALSPLKVLGRGYAIAQKADDRMLYSVKDAAPGDAFRLRLSDGELGCRVERVP